MPILNRKSFGALALLASTASAHAQCGEWLPGEGILGTDAVVRDILAWDPDGPGGEPEKLVIAGDFVAAGDVTTRGVAMWDGSSWQSLGEGLSGRVRALAIYNGELIAAGSFAMAGQVFRWDGSAWQSLGSAFAGGGTFFGVHALVIHNGDLYAGGDFATVGGNDAPGLARWDGNAWQTVGGGVTGGWVASLAIYNNELVAGGNFTSAGSTPVNRMARWNGSQWADVGGGVTYTGAPLVFTLNVYNNELIAGGEFNAAGGVPVNNIARWNGATWQTLAQGVTSIQLSDSVWDSLVVGNDLYVVGRFDRAGTVTSVRNIARWNGTNWFKLRGGVGGTEYEDVIALGYYNSRLVVGGGLTAANVLEQPNAIVADGLAMWDGSAWSTDWGPAIDGFIQHITEYQGNMIVSGFFNRIGDTDIANSASWNGNEWSTVGDDVPSTLGTSTMYQGEIVFAGPHFNEQGGVAFGPSAWDGTTWHGFGAGSNGVATVAVYNGDLIAAGGFTTIGGVPANRIARWDGAAWHAMGTGFAENFATIYALAVYNGDLFAAGVFTNAGGHNTIDVARWDGSWHPVGSGVTGGAVYTLQVYNGELYAGGTITNRIARWNGTTWQSVGTGMTGTIQPSVRGLFVYEGSLVAVGSFTRAGGQLAGNVARWDGTAWSAFGVGTEANRTAYGVGQYRGELVVGGDMRIAGNLVSGRWARWASGNPFFADQPESSEAPCEGAAAFSVEVTNTGSNAVTYQWRRNGADLADGPTGTGSTVSGATSASLSISSVSDADEGTYDCVATTSCGTTPSTAATLAVGACCPADFDGDGFVSGTDFDLYVQAFEAGDTSADFDGDGFVSGVDFDLYVQAFEAGC